MRRRGRVVAVIITAAAVPPASWRSFGEAGVPSTTMSKMASSLKADVAGTGVNMMMNEIHLIECSRQARALYRLRCVGGQQGGAGRGGRAGTTIILRYFTSGASCCVVMSRNFVGDLHMLEFVGLN